MKILSLGLFVLLSIPLVDFYLDGDMALQMLVQIPLLILAGTLLTGRFSHLLDPPKAFGLFILSLGVVFFWMIPRSLDLAVVGDGVDRLMHLCLFLAGLGLRTSLGPLNLMIRIAAGIYATAMWSAFALILFQSPAQVCARFTLAQQQSAGQAMLWAGGCFLTVHLLSSVVLLVRLGPKEHPST